MDKPPPPWQPLVEYRCAKNIFMMDVKRKFDKLGEIHTSTGNYTQDLKESVSYGLSLVSQATSNLGSYLWTKKHETTELKEIPPPLLCIYLGVERAMAEEFVEIFTVTASEMPSGHILFFLFFLCFFAFLVSA